LKKTEDFSRALVRDLRALKIMLDRGMIETGVSRIGAEQELYIIDNLWQPRPAVARILKSLSDRHFAVELAKFNIEINLDPEPFTGSCLSDIENRLNEHISKLNRAAGEYGLGTILVGILPTVKQSDLGPENLIDDPRYEALCAILNAEREHPYQLRINGIDELIASHDTPMYESCNTSFQVHLQVSPENCVNLYNISQAVAAPVLACSTNSPLLMGKKLWSETRIALFQQAIDTRAGSYDSREKSPRVTFGKGWLRDSILDIFYDSVARYKVLLSPDLRENSLKMLEEGEMPHLSALQIYNSTVWRWNRVCYGLTCGVPHLRIENRILPSGPTVRDEVANAAFWLGLMNGMPEVYSEIPDLIEFDNVKENFINAARVGLDAKFNWVDGKSYDADELVLKELLPVSKSGLRSARVSDDEIDLYLSIIEERVRAKRTGSHWIIDSYNGLRRQAQSQEAEIALTAGLSKRQMTGEPVHMWDNAKLEDAGKWLERCKYVERVMSTDLFVVTDSDILDLAVSIINWKHVRHIPVENEKGSFVGLLTSGTILNYYGSRMEEDRKPVLVREIMITDPVTVRPDTETTEAISIMKENKVGCLPVVKDDKLVGIVTEHDFMNLSANLLKEISKAGMSGGDEKK